MPDVQILTASSGRKQQDTNTWATVCQIPAGSFTAGDKYLIVAVAHSMLNDTAQELQLRLVHGTTPTQFTDAYEADEVLAHKVVGTGFMAVYTQPGTTEAVTLEYRVSTNGLGDDHLIHYARLVAINLDDIGTQNTDYWYAEDTTDTSISTTPTDFASVTWTPNGTDKYLYFAQVAWNWVGDPTATSAGFDLVYDGTTQTKVFEEGEDQTNEQRNRLLVWANTPTNASHTVKVQGYSESGTIVQHLSSRVFALNLSSFSDQHIATPSDHTLTSVATWENAWTTSFTPSASQDYFIVASQLEDSGTNQDPGTQYSLQINPDGNGLYDYPGTLLARDTFTEASGTPLLTAHTSDSGNSYVERWQGAQVHWYVNSTNDTADLNGGADDFDYAVTNLSGVSLADGYVEYQVTSAGDGVGMHVRWKGTSSTTEDCYRIRQGTLYRVTNGAATSLGTAGNGPWYRLYASSTSPTELVVISATTQAGLRDTFVETTGWVPALITSDSTAENQTASGEVGFYGAYDDFGQQGGNIDNMRVVADAYLQNIPDGGTWDVSDNSPHTFFDTVPFVSGASRTINLDHRMHNSAQTTKASILDPVFVAFSKALAGGGPTQYQQALTAAISPAGTALRSTGKALAASLSPASALGRTANRVLAAATAALTPSVVFSRAASVAMTYQQALTAALSFAGSVAKSTRRALAAALSPAGALTRSTSKALAGALTPAGALSTVTAYLRSLAASLTPSGALTRVASFRRALSGTLSSAGNLTTSSVLHAVLTAALSFTSAMGRTATKTLDAATASLTFDVATSRVRQVTGGLTQAFNASLAFAGAVTRSTARSLTASLAPGASLVRSTRRSLAAALSPAGDVARRTGKALSGTLSSTASLAKRTSTSLSATLAPAGDIVKRTARSLAASLTSAASLTTQKLVGGPFTEAFTASVDFTTSLARTTARGLAATLAPAGALARTTARALTASLSPSGLLDRVTSFRRLLAADLNPSATLARLPRKALDATLAPVGSLARSTSKALSASLDFATSLVRQTRRAFAAAQTFVGDLSAQLVGALAIAFNAALTPASSLGRVADRVLDAAQANLNPTGSLGRVRRALLALTASLTFTGDVAKRTARSLVAALTPAATLTRRTSKALAASLAPAASLTRRTNKALAASLAPTGAFIRRTSRAFAASVSPAASFVAGLATNTYTYLANATLTFAGAVNRRTLRVVEAALAVNGALARSTRRSIAATLTFAATFGRGRFMAFTASLGFVAAFVGAARTRLASRLPAFARAIGGTAARVRGSAANRTQGTSGSRTRGSTDTRD